jgi:hypothetical protein
MRDALAWLHESALGTFIRDSGLWTYPIVNVIHVVGVATLFGAVLTLDLRLLGVWRRGQPVSVGEVRCHRIRTAERRRAAPHCGVEGSRDPSNIPHRVAAAGAHGWCIACQLAHGGHGRADDRILVIKAFITHGAVSGCRGCSRPRHSGFVR